MEKLSDLRNVSTQEFDWLKHKIDSLPLLKPYLFDNISLYPDCTPESTTIGFYRNEQGYALFFNEKISYSGGNQILNRLFSDGLIVADTMDHLQAFCQQLPDESVNEPPDTSPVVTVEDDITDFDAITIPKDEVVTLSFDFIRNELRKTVIGQDLAVDIVAYQLAAHLAKPNPKRPLTLLFHGVPATGKSELAKAIGDLLSRYCSHKYGVVWVDLNTYTEAHTVHNLTGAPASYIGHDEPPVFYSVVENPYTVFIWDEVEKSHPAVLKLFMGIMDEGRCASNKELPDHTREYDFRHSIHIFTTNSPIGELSVNKRPIGFATSTDIKDISYEDDAINVEYKEGSKEAEQSLVQRIYDQNEKARRALVRTGVLPEIATRFSGFAEFKPLSDTAKIRIIAKTILTTGFEYGIKLKYIAPTIIQEMANAAGKDGFSVRSYRTIAEGYLSSTFSATQAVSGPDSGEYRLEGTLAEPQLNPA